jgi:hypothetical protein
MNPNYAIVVKQDLDKLLNVGFITPIERASWFTNCCYIEKERQVLNLHEFLTKNDPYPLPFIKKVLNKVAGHEVYSCFNGFSNYHQIMIISKDRYKTIFITDWGAFIWVVMPFGLKNAPLTYQWVVSTTFKDYLGVFMKLFLDDFNMFSNLDTRLSKLQLCLDKCR